MEKHPEFWSSSLRDDSCKRWSSPVRSQALENEHERERATSVQQRPPSFKRKHSIKQLAVESDGDYKAISLAQKPILARTTDEIRDVTSYLASICAFFSLWPVGLQAELVRLLNVHILVRGEVILTKGKAPENLYIILKGRMEVRVPVLREGGGREEASVAVLVRGQTVGESVLLGATAHHSTVCVGSPSAVLLSLSRPQCLRAFKEVLDIRSQDRLLYLRNHPLFASLSNRALAAVSDALHLSFQPPGTRMWPPEGREGAGRGVSEPRSVFLLAEGAARVRRDRALAVPLEGDPSTGRVYDRSTVSLLGPGAIFGLPISASLAPTISSGHQLGPGQARASSPAHPPLSAGVGSTSSNGRLLSPTPGGRAHTGSTSNTLAASFRQALANAGSNGSLGLTGLDGNALGERGSAGMPPVVVESWSQVKVYSIRYADLAKLPIEAQQVLVDANAFNWSYYDGRMDGLARMETKRRVAQRKALLKRAQAANALTQGGTSSGPGTMGQYGSVGHHSHMGLEAPGVLAAMTAATDGNNMLSKMPVLVPSVEKTPPAIQAKLAAAVASMNAALPSDDAQAMLQMAMAAEGGQLPAAAGARSSMPGSIDGSTGLGTLQPLAGFSTNAAVHSGASKATGMAGFGPKLGARYRGNLGLARVAAMQVAHMLVGEGAGLGYSQCATAMATAGAVAGNGRPMTVGIGGVLGGKSFSGHAGPPSRQWSLYGNLPQSFHAAAGQGAYCGNYSFMALPRRSALSDVVVPRDGIIASTGTALDGQDGEDAELVSPFSSLAQVLDPAAPQANRPDPHARDLRPQSRSVEFAALPSAVKGLCVSHPSLGTAAQQQDSSRLSEGRNASDEESLSTHSRQGHLTRIYHERDGGIDSSRMPSQAEVLSQQHGRLKHLAHPWAHMDAVSRPEAHAPQLPTLKVLRPDAYTFPRVLAFRHYTALTEVPRPQSVPISLRQRHLGVFKCAQAATRALVAARGASPGRKASSGPMGGLVSALTRMPESRVRSSARRRSRSRSTHASVQGMVRQSSSSGTAAAVAVLTHTPSGGLPPPTYAQLLEAAALGAAPGAGGGNSAAIAGAYFSSPEDDLDGDMPLLLPGTGFGLPMQRVSPAPSGTGLTHGSAAPAYGTADGNQLGATLRAGAAAAGIDDAKESDLLEWLSDGSISPDDLELGASAQTYDSRLSPRGPAKAADTVSRGASIGIGSSSNSRQEPTQQQQAASLNRPQCAAARTTGAILSHGGHAAPSGTAVQTAGAGVDPLNMSMRRGTALATSAAEPAGSKHARPQRHVQVQSPSKKGPPTSGGELGVKGSQGNSSSSHSKQQQKVAESSIYTHLSVSVSANDEIYESRSGTGPMHCGPMGQPSPGGGHAPASPCFANEKPASVAIPPSVMLGYESLDPFQWAALLSHGTSHGPHASHSPRASGTTHGSPGVMRAGGSHVQGGPFGGGMRAGTMGSGAVSTQDTMLPVPRW